MINRDHWEKENAQINNTEENFRDPLPQDPIAQILLKYFDHRYDYIQAQAKQRGKKIKWRTVKSHLLLKRNLWKDWNKESKIIGLSFGKHTRRIVIDIDIDSPYHPNNDEEAYQKLLHTLEDLGLCGHIPIQSSWSQGIHIYNFLAKPVSSYYASLCIQTAFRAAGFEIKNGHLEVFPNTKSYGDSKKGKFTHYKAHRLPLQPGTGSFILSPYSLEFKGLSLEKFAHMAEASAQDNDVEHFQRMIELCRDSKPQYWENHKKRHKVREWQTHLWDFISEGWTDYHQTNVLLGKIAIQCHVFEKKQGDELIDAMVELAISLPGYRKYCRHQHEIYRRCKDWARSVQIHYRMLYEYPQREENYTEMFNRTAADKSNKNDIKSQEASNKIKRVYDHIIETIATVPQKISDLIQLINETAKKLTGQGVSKNTLFKEHNLPLWHPQYLKSKYQVVEKSLPSEGERTPGPNQQETSRHSDDTQIQSKVNPGGEKQTSVPTTDSSQPVTPNPHKASGTKKSKKTTEKPILRQELQSKQAQQGTSENHPTPSEVARSNQENLNKPESVPANKSDDSSHTLPYMKCNSIPDSDSGAASQRLTPAPDKSSSNEVEGGLRGDSPETEAENQAETGEIGQNSDSVGENADKGILALFDVRRMLTEEFHKAIASLPFAEKMKLTGERLKLNQRAKDLAKGQFLGKIPKGDEEEICELWKRMELFRRTRIKAFWAEVNLWCQLVSEGRLGEIELPPGWEF